MRSSWWADAGPETCQSCSVTYYAEVGFNCAHCDSDICPICAVTVFERRDVLCPACSEGGEN